MKSPLEELRDDVAARAENAHNQLIKFNWDKNSITLYDKLENKRNKLSKFLDKLNIMLEEYTLNN